MFVWKVPAQSSSQPHILISSDQSRTTKDPGFSSSTAGNAVTLGFEDNFTDLSCFASSRPGVVPWQSSSSDTESYSKDDKVTLQPWRPIEKLSPQSSVDDLLLL
ncbi:hypothetical protein NP493_231g00000 [Ridgeia piscesae]|uniref:Uncharacterized protein n=1 Tax=Ridgeia piscesae TaxID=27915 RepID=A0AAD9NZV0_RIDPI|nr:hypothetical protein NP493_231g00000 [Ridgeia piscesae]